MTTCLYGYWRSSAAYRVRIALNLKGVVYDQSPVHLVKDGGEQHSAEHKARNPLSLVPALEIDGHTLIESPAILEYLEDTRPDPALMPSDPLGRAQVRAFASHIACNIHPIGNLRVLQHLKTKGFDESEIKGWMQTWIAKGFIGLEALAQRQPNPEGWLFGDGPSLAEVYLVPQMYNARRWGVDLVAFPRLVAADQTAMIHDAFVRAAPEAQPDAA